MNWLGDFPEDFTTVTCMFTTHASTGAPVAPSTAFENADVIIYKNGSATQKTSQNGVTMTSPFDSITGLHCLTIDTSNDTGDGGFWVAGAVYTLVLSPDTETVDSLAVAKVIGQFGIELYGALRPATAGRKLVVDAAGLADANAVKVGPTGSGTAQTARDVGASVIAASVSTGGIVAASFAANALDAVWSTTVRSLSTGANIQLPSNGLANVTAWTVAITGNITGNLSGSVGSVTGAVGSVTGAVGSVTGLTASDVGAIKTKTDSLTFTTSLRVDCQVFGIQANAITATAIAADAITAAKIADGAIDAATFAAGAINAAAIAADAITDAKVASDVTIASVTGAVGSVTGAVGSVTGSVGSVATGGITAASFAADAITAAKIAADVTTELQAGLATAAALSTVAGNVTSIKTSTDALPSDPADQSLVIAATSAIAAAIAALNNLSAAQVKTQVVDALNVDTYAEPGQGTPAATASLVTKLGYVYKAARNKRTQTAGIFSLYDDAGTTVDQKGTVSDDGTTFTASKIVSGP